MTLAMWIEIIKVILTFLGLPLVLTVAWYSHRTALHRQEREFRLKKLEELYLLCSAMLELRTLGHFKVLKDIANRADLEFTMCIQDLEQSNRALMLGLIYFEKLMSAITAYTAALADFDKDNAGMIEKAASKSLSPSEAERRDGVINAGMVAYAHMITELKTEADRLKDEHIFSTGTQAIATQVARFKAFISAQLH